MNERKVGIIINYINIVLHTLVGFLYVPLLLHYIGKSEYGLYQLIGTMITYFSIMDFGLTSAVVRFYSKYKALGDKLKVENILAISFRLYMVITIIILFVGSICYANIDTIFSNSMSIDEIKSAKNLFLLLLFNVAITISTFIFRAIITANEKFILLNGLATINAFCQPILVILILQKYPYAFAVAAVQTFLNISMTAFRIYYCFYKLHIKIKFHYFDKELFNDFKKLAISVFVVALIDQIFFRTNQVILGIISGTAAVAVYSISSLIYLNYMTLSTSITNVYLPHITTIITKNEPINKLSDLFIKIGRLQYFLLALVGSGFVIFGRQFITIWAGNGFEDAYYIILLIIIPLSIELTQNIGLTIMQAQNKYDFRAKVYFCMGIFNLCAAIPLGLKYGGIGCAFATGFAMFIGNGLIMNWYYAKVTGLAIKRFWQQIGRICIGVVLLTVFGHCANDFFSTDSKLYFVLKIVFYSFVYFIVMYKFYMNMEEKERIKAIFYMMRNNRSES